MYLSGGRDPDNREALWDHGYNGNDFIRTLNKLRQIAISKYSTFITTPAIYLHGSSEYLFYQKGSILIGLNGRGEKSTAKVDSLALRIKRYSLPEVLIEVLSCAEVIVGMEQVSITMTDGSPVVYYPKLSLVDTGICGY